MPRGHGGVDSAMIRSDAHARADDDDSDEMPTTGAKNGLRLIDLRGADYDDAK